MAENVFLTCKIKLDVPVSSKKDALAVLGPKRGNSTPGQLAKARYNEIDGATGDGWMSSWLKEHDVAVKLKI